MNNKHSLAKLTAAILFLVLIVGMSGCSGDNSNAKESNDTNIPVSDNEAKTSDDRTADTDAIGFKYLYRGFTAVMYDDAEARASFDDIAGDRVILTNDDWHSYMEKYCPGIPYYDCVDWTSQCLIAITIGNAKPAYASSLTIRSISIENDALHIEYDDDPSACIYALNTDTVTHFFISILIVNKGDLPDNVSDDWVYKD